MSHGTTLEMYAAYLAACNAREAIAGGRIAELWGTADNARLRVVSPAPRPR